MIVIRHPFIIITHNAVYSIKSTKNTLYIYLFIYVIYIGLIV